MTGIIHRFGRVEVRPGERKLLVDGKPAAIGARAFDVLNALAERRDRVVSKDELMDLVWPGLVVEENNLQVQVSALRKLLGPQAIATVPGRGYRFTLGDDAGDEAKITPAARAVPAVVAEPLIGRDEDRANLTSLLDQHRLVVVIGAAGVGKTTLARAIASAVSATSVMGWVELAPITDFALIPGAIAQALQLPLEGAAPEAALLAAARPLVGLLVLDNAEHLIEPLARLVPRLLGASPGLQLLVTSQAPLKVDAEWLFRLAPLSCPPAGAQLDEALPHGAIALFVAQAKAAGFRLTLDEKNVAAVVDICRRLDGIPLAVKLAAARLPLLGLAGLNAGLAQCLKILGGGPRDPIMRRQATLEAAFDWSHSLLAQREQVVFRRLAVFVGGFTLSAACAVCRDEQLDDADVIDALGGLVDRSFVVVEGEAQPRYHLLQTAREYALTQLERIDERVDCERRHAKAMLELLENSYDTYVQESKDGLWNVVAKDLDNLRAAIGWGIVHDAALAARLTGEARPLFLMTGLLHEARIWSDRVEPLISDAVPADAAALFWRLRGQALSDVPERAAAAALKSVELFRQAGDRRKRFGALNEAIADTSLPLATKEGLLNELRQLDASGRTAWSHTYLLACEALVAWLRGDLRAARETYLRAFSASPTTQNRTELLTFLARVEELLGMHEAAIGHARQAVALAAQYGPSVRLTGLPTLAGVLIESGRLTEARAILEETVTLSRSAGWWRFGEIARRLVCLAAQEGRPADAARLLGYLSGLDVPIDPTAEPTEAHLQSLGEAVTSAALAPDELARLMDEGRALTEAGVCDLGLAMLPDAE